MTTDKTGWRGTTEFSDGMVVDRKGNKNRDSDREVEFQAFIDRLRQRHSEGERKYGNHSYNRPVSEVYKEAAEEAVDIPGWLYFAWRKDHDFRDEIEKLCADAYSIHERLLRLKWRAEKEGVCTYGHDETGSVKL